LHSAQPVVKNHDVSQQKGGKEGRYVTQGLDSVKYGSQEFPGPLLDNVKLAEPQEQVG